MSRPSNIAVTDATPRPTPPPVAQPAPAKPHPPPQPFPDHAPDHFGRQSPTPPPPHQEPEPEPMDTSDDRLVDPRKNGDTEPVAHVFTPPTIANAARFSKKGELHLVRIYLNNFVLFMIRFLSYSRSEATMPSYITGTMSLSTLNWMPPRLTIPFLTSP